MTSKPCLCVQFPALKFCEAEGAVEVAVEFVEVADVLLQRAREVADLLHLDDEVGAGEEGRARAHERAPALPGAAPARRRAARAAAIAPRLAPQQRREQAQNVLLLPFLRGLRFADQGRGRGGGRLLLRL